MYKDNLEFNKNTLEQIGPFHKYHSASRELPVFRYTELLKNCYRLRTVSESKERSFPGISQVMGRI